MKSMLQKSLNKGGFLAALLLLHCTHCILAQHQFRASDGSANDLFGGHGIGYGTPYDGNNVVSVFGTYGLSGARDHDNGGPPATNSGAAYFYRNIHTASGNVTQDVKLTASDGGTGHRFGASTAFDGQHALIGAIGATGLSGNPNRGAAYYFRNLDTTPLSNVTQDIKLVAQNGAAANDRFGYSVSLGNVGSNLMALVGADQAEAIRTNPSTSTFSDGGAAYLYRNLQLVPSGSTITEDLRLMASDLSGNWRFGHDVVLRGSSAVVGAPLAPLPGGFSGAAYLFRNLDTATGPIVYEHARLSHTQEMASLGASGFGNVVAMSENETIAAVGGPMANGIIYLYNDLTTIDFTINGVNYISPNAILLSSDGNIGGNDIAISGTTLIGAAKNNWPINEKQGAFYIYTDIHTASSGIPQNTSIIQTTNTATFVRETAKVWRSAGIFEDTFANSLALQGTQFFIGEPGNDAVANNAGAAYTGDTRTFVGLDDSISLSTNGLSFWSRQNWVIGTNNDNNTITISAGDVARLNYLSGTQTVVGQNAGSDNNTLNVNGILQAQTIAVGSSGSNNTMVIGPTGTVNMNTFPNQQLIVGDTATAQNNTVLVQSGGVLTNTATGNITSIGRSTNSNNNQMIVDGTVNSRLTYVGQSGSSNSMVITSTGVYNLTAGERFVVGQASASNSNTVTVQSGGVLNAGGTGSILSVGRFGKNNAMFVDGTVNSSVTHVGETANSNGNLLTISTGGVLNQFGNLSVGANSNLNNSMHVNGIVNLGSGSVLNVFQRHILSGSGTIQGPGSNVTITGSLRPGSGSGGSGIGTLTRNDGDVTWNGFALSPWVFELGIAQPTMLLANTGGTRDLLDITSGNFLKGSGSSFVFDFAGTGWGGWYKLVDWTGTTNFSVTDFTAVNINPVVTSYQFFIDNGPGSTTALYIYMIPEPQVWAMLSVVLGALIALRQRLRKAARAQSTPVV